MFTNYAQEHEISIDNEFKFNKTRLKRFVRVNINKDGINLKFSRGDWNDKIKLSDEDPNIVIIESASFAKAIREID